MPLPSSAHLLAKELLPPTILVYTPTDPNLASNACGSIQNTKYASNVQTLSRCKSGISFWRRVGGFVGCAGGFPRGSIVFMPG